MHVGIASPWRRGKRSRRYRRMRNLQFYVSGKRPKLSRHCLNLKSIPGLMSGPVLSIIRGVPSFATRSPCNVWDRVWTTSLLYGGPLSGFSFFLKINSWYVIYSGDNYFYDIFFLFLVLVCFTLPKFACYISSLYILLWNNFFLYKVPIHRFCNGT